MYSAISEQTEHVFDVVTRQMIHKILIDLGPLPEIDNYITIDNGYNAPQNTSNEQHGIILANDKLHVTVANNTNPRSLKWDTLTGLHMTGQYVSKKQSIEQFRPIYADKLIDVVLSEMTVPCSMSLDFNIQLLDRDQAYSLPAEIFRRYAPGLVYTELISYDYPIPIDIVSMLYSIFKMRKFSTPITFKQYIAGCSNNKFQCVVPRANTKNQVELVYPKQLINVVTTIEYTEEKPEAIKVQRAAGGYEVKFTVHFQFERADMLTLKYPCIVDNVLVPEIMLPKQNSSRPMPSMDGPYPLFGMNNAIKSLEKIKPSAIRMPAYDDWLIPQELAFARSYREFLTAAFLIDETAPDGYTEIDLCDDLTGEGDYLHPTVIEILKIQKRESFRVDCIFHVDVYLGDCIIEPSTITITDDFKLRVPCVDIHKPHRIMLSEITDVKYLDPKWLKYIIQYWPFFLISLQVSDLLKNGLLEFDGTKLDDPANNVLGGTYDSYWPLRIIKADIITRHESTGNNQS